MNKSDKIQKLIELDTSSFIDVITPYVYENKEKILNALTASDIDKIYRKIQPSSTPSKSKKSSTISSSAVLHVPIQPPRSRKNKPVSKKFLKDQKEALERVEFHKNEEFILDRKTFKINDEITRREDSIMYSGTDMKTGDDVFIKIQPRDLTKKKLTTFQITTEHHILTKLQRSSNKTRNCLEFSQKPIAYGSYSPPGKTEDDRYILVSSLHGNDLKTLIGADIQTIKEYSKKSVNALKNIHQCDIVHLDVKHENFAFEKKGTNSGNVVVIDYGTAESVYDRNGKRKKDDKKDVEGTPIYMSIKQHEKQASDYMHDLQAIAYMIMDLLNMITWKTKETEYEMYIEKVNLLNKYKNGELNHNMKVIGMLIDYTTKTDITEFNSQHYKDINNIIDMLS